ncbi:MAG: type 1 glutamine amidotransferase [Acidobacteria bacterium]|nr:MAG: type 1 glutamine amidotransferase [Acidobacteriota bacterium]
MTTSRDHLRLVLVQIRDHRESLMQERSAFIERCLVNVDQFDFINIVEHPQLRWQDVESAHAVLIGGAGGYSVIGDHPFSPYLRDVVSRLIDEDRPVFGSCWGHQFMARAMGGEVIVDRENSEVGSFEISLTEKGSNDPLLETLPPSFFVQLGHNDRVSRLPEGWVELAASEKCPNQIIRLEGKPVYGTQFHSEMNEDRLRERLQVYLQEYVPDPEGFEELMARLRPSPQADCILDRFLA